LSEEKTKPRIPYKQYKIAQTFGHTTLKPLYAPKAKPKVPSKEETEINLKIMELENRIHRIKGLAVVNNRELTDVEKRLIKHLENKIKVLRDTLAKKVGEK
jgi:hypothetical protein